MGPTAQRSPARSYFTELSAAFLLYAAILIPSIIWLRANPEASGRWAVALLPVLPVLLVLWAVLRFVFRVDELGRRMATEALAAAFAGSAVLVITAGLLEVGGVPRISPWGIWLGMAAMWALAAGAVSLRYR